jgi:hypothetical protein
MGISYLTFLKRKELVEALRKHLLKFSNYIQIGIYFVIHFHYVILNKWIDQLRIVNIS